MQAYISAFRSKFHAYPYGLFHCALAAALYITATAASAQKPQYAIGDTTSALLKMQADGSAAAAVLPMLGVEGNLSWQRYLDSFNHPIPEYFGDALKKIGGGQ